MTIPLKLYSALATCVAAAGVDATQVTVEDSLAISGSGTLAIRIDKPNPLVEFRSSGTYAAFLQSLDSDFYVANRLAGNLFFRTSDANRMKIDAAGNVGIGTMNLSESRLVVNGPENDGTIAGVEVRSGSQKLLFDGNEIDCISGALHLNYNSLEDVLVRTAVRRADVTLNHSSGSGAGQGVAIVNSGNNGVYWTLYATNNDGNLELYQKGAFRGEFDSTTGAYSTVSDRRIKEDIRTFDNGLEVVRKLKPRTYLLADDEAARPRIGFIAQEVAEVLPGLVTGSLRDDGTEGHFAVDYDGFAPVGIGAIQELDERCRALEEENRKLERRLTRLEELVRNPASH